MTPTRAPSHPQSWFDIPLRDLERVCALHASVRCPQRRAAPPRPALPR